MSAGPLRRVAAVLGMVALLPVLLQLATGAITPEDAAIRAMAVGVVVIALGNLARLFLTGALRRVERAPESAEPERRAGERRSDERRGEARRATDRQPTDAAPA